MTYRSWSVAHAKSKLSDVLAAAESAPQYITNRGRETAVVLGVEEFLRLTRSAEDAAPAARLRRFLGICEALRGEGGGELKPARRSARRSPFAARGY